MRERRAPACNLEPGGAQEQVVETLHGFVVGGTAGAEIAQPGARLVVEREKRLVHDGREASNGHALFVTPRRYFLRVRPLGVGNPY